MRVLWQIVEDKEQNTILKFHLQVADYKEQDTHKITEKKWSAENKTLTKSLNNSGVQRTKHQIIDYWWSTEGMTYAKSLISSGVQRTRH